MQHIAYQGLDQTLMARQSGLPIYGVNQNIGQCSMVSGEHWSCGMQFNMSDLALVWLPS